MTAAIEIFSFSCISMVISALQVAFAEINPSAELCLLSQNDILVLVSLILLEQINSPLAISKISSLFPVVAHGPCSRGPALDSMYMYC